MEWVSVEMNCSVQRKLCATMSCWLLKKWGDTCVNLACSGFFLNHSWREASHDHGGQGVQVSACCRCARHAHKGREEPPASLQPCSPEAPVCSRLFCCLPVVLLGPGQCPSCFCSVYQCSANINLDREGHCMWIFLSHKAYRTNGHFGFPSRLFLAGKKEFS